MKVLFFNTFLKLLLVFSFVFVFFHTVCSQEKVNILKKDLNEQKVLKEFEKYEKRKVDKGNNETWSIEGCTFWFFPQYTLKVPIDTNLKQANLINSLKLDNNICHAYILQNGNYHGTISINYFLSGIAANNRFKNDSYGDREVNFLRSLNSDFIFIINGLYGLFYIKNDKFMMADITLLKTYDFDEYIAKKIYEKNKVWNYLIPGEETFNSKKEAYKYMERSNKPAIVIIDGKITIVNYVIEYASGFFNIPFYEFYVIDPEDPLCRPYHLLTSKHNVIFKSSKKN